MQTAQHQRSRLEQKLNPAIIPLHSIDDIRRVQALMDEESPTNKKGASSRVIPLIRHIDYQISSRQPRNHDGLAFINLTDTPGSAAMTVAHDEQLRKQLNPFATDAIILVMKPHRPEAMIRERLRAAPSRPPMDEAPPFAPPPGWRPDRDTVHLLWLLVHRHAQVSARRRLHPCARRCLGQPHPQPPR